MNNDPRRRLGGESFRHGFSPPPLQAAKAMAPILTKPSNPGTDSHQTQAVKASGDGDRIGREVAGAPVRGFVEAHADDGLLEIFGLKQGWHASFVMVELVSAKHIAQVQYQTRNSYCLCYRVKF
ncbi:hypothetical protein SO802_015399 [Lithocarpus litseifolius]|uniref:Uncharacterized protein n=1 Tax=Lithocarpus litseifolius TaxID=425828 RepID=A0AAW2CVN6_9ROSI